MRYDATSLIVGPPGCGKTYALIETVKDLLAEDIHPSRIVFITFTRKAAKEARERAQEAFDLSKEDLCYFKTLHSLAYHELGLNRKQLMTSNDYIALGKLLNIRISLKFKQEEDLLPSGTTAGDRMLFYDNLARIKLVPLQDLYSSLRKENIVWAELERFSATLKKYKKHYQKLDYTDMISRYIKGGPNIQADYTIVDEAQDLSRIQWEMVSKLSKQMKEVYVAGDDDQAIFRWAGADVDTFIDLASKAKNVKVLDQSYRVPKKVQALANRVISQVNNRVPKTWNPLKEHEGEVYTYNDITQIDISKGTWLMLSRNIMFLDFYRYLCIQKGHLFSCRTGSPIQPGMLHGIIAWEALRRGQKIPAIGVSNAYVWLPIGEGLKRGSKQKVKDLEPRHMLSMEDLVKDYGLRRQDIWHESLTRIPLKTREYIIAALKQGEKVTKNPRITIQTIHGVKGGEADHVLLMMDMAKRTYDEMEVQIEDELRVWYVAITRARKSIHILLPQTNLSMPLPLSI